MRTVSVNVMWDVQEKNYFSAWEHLWDAKDRTRGFLWGGDPLCRQRRALEQRHPGAPSAAFLALGNQENRRPLC
jgi:hypothetical protein